ncbi:MAG: CheR family methyltransferase [Polyangiales bacterium]
MPILFDRGPRIRVEEFRLLRDLINGFCGIYFGDDSMFVVERRLRDRLQALGLGDFGQYYQHLRYHPDSRAELERAVDVLTTNETYFFREDYQLAAFRDEILPELHRRGEEAGSRRLTVWSAGCSTGEEVYSLAMLVSEMPVFEGWDVRIFGNDISRRVLRTARHAVYGPSSFRTMQPEYERHFVETPEGRQVHPRIQAMCHFGHVNLLDRSRVGVVGRVHVIFCRNVLIYFDPESRSKVIDTFYERLLPGGYLLLGHSESLLNTSTAFELAHLSSDLVYRRPRLGGAR